MEELYKLIEDYLNNRLPEDRRRELEQRMEKDAEFRKEVELHRAMQEEFSDVRGWNLYASLQEIMQEDEAPEIVGSPGDNKKQSRKWLWAIILCIVAGMLFWYFSSISKPAMTNPTAPSPAIDAIENLPKGNNPQEQKVEDKVVPTNDPPPQKSPNEKQQMASIDPKNFEPNPTMESYIHSGGTLGTGRAGVRMDKPQQTATFSPNKGATQLQFTGRFYGLRPEKDNKYAFNIFDNKNSLDPRLIIALEPKADSSGEASFKAAKKTRLAPGLYYYQIEHESSGAVLVTGKFFVGPVN